MSRILPPLVLLCLVVGGSADTTGLQTIEVERVSSLLDSGATLTVIDANSADTRAKHGVIPGAVLLTSYRDYDVAGELPADTSRRLVFYCYNALCGAAAEAARKAVGAGYTDVAVMPAGIKGWLGEGRPVSTPEAI